ncbi:uncharacterized protein B0H18DRAFT_870613 [Fomitopsis serialis]|uniref:uncharacterized protein n=1 Tax=Fomitopsis serialis TaxID=139415 RepID=UPI0020085E5D|nr:uncharacterized protein B0H18DRAFT_870613 [Neoantrodia serialis]KAH9933311.1 hypothetical protein B0H18DRAFT_870613 [Neoantrodia serialis]
MALEGGAEAVRATLRNSKLDESLYSLDEEESAFFKSLTGIDDDEALKQHILKVQNDAFEVWPFPCIRRFSFTKLKISRLPAYPQLLTLGKHRQGAILLDLGTCFGNDVRKAVIDGFPVRNTIGSDIEPAFWRLGHELFNSSPETFPSTFIAGDVFDPVFLETHPLPKATPDDSVPKLDTLTSLNPLQGRVSAIHASAFFHLFAESKQRELARAVAGLLSPDPGSLILGVHAAAPEKGIRRAAGGEKPFELFCDSPESWKEMWEGIFEPGTVKIETELKEMPNSAQSTGIDMQFWEMSWSVTRV